MCIRDSTCISFIRKEKNIPEIVTLTQDADRKMCIRDRLIVRHSLESGTNSHLRLAEAHVTAHQAVDVYKRQPL